MTLSTVNMAGHFLVRETAGFRKALQLAENDGVQLAPLGGILLHPVKRGEYSSFRTRRDAEEAIERTVAWGEAQRYRWKPEDYEIQSVANYEDELAAKQRRRRSSPRSERGEKI